MPIGINRQTSSRRTDKGFPLQHPQTPQSFQVLQLLTSEDYIFSASFIMNVHQSSHTALPTWSVKLNPLCKCAIQRIRQEFPDISTHSEAVAVAVAFTYEAVVRQGIQRLPVLDMVLPADEGVFDD